MSWHLPLIRRGGWVAAPERRLFDLTWYHKAVGLLFDSLSPEITVPERLRAAAALTDFAVMVRYPGIAEPVSEQEYHEALHLADAVVAWAERMVKDSGG